LEGKVFSHTFLAFKWIKGKWFDVEGGQIEVGCEGEVLYSESGEVL